MPAPDPISDKALVEHPLGAAVIEVVVRRGYEAAEVDEIVRSAGVDRAEFDRLFRDKAHAVLRALEAYVDNFKSQVKRAFESRPTWPDNLRMAAYAAAYWLRENPDATRFGAVEVLSAGEMAQIRREEVFSWCSALIDAGREVAADPSAVPQAAPIMAIGSIAEILTRRLQDEEDIEPLAMVPQMMYGAVRPYLGEEAARRELTIPPPESDPAGDPPR